MIKECFFVSSRRDWACPCLDACNKDTHKGRPYVSFRMTKLLIVMRWLYILKKYDILLILNILYDNIT